MSESNQRSAGDDVEPLPSAPPLELQKAQAERLLRIWRTPTGFRYWSSVNNTDVGKWYTALAFFFLLFGGVLALLMRLQLAFPNNDFLSANFYNQAFTVHGSVMMFLFAIPIFEAVAVILMPQMLGARDLPFPRLAAFGFWCFLIGGVFLCGSIFFDAAPSGGWFMYPPLTSAFQPDIGADIWLLGFSFIEVAAIASAVELIVGVLKCRPPGMRIHLIPLYAWYTLVGAIMIVFAFPPLIAGSMMLEIERAFHWPFFDATRGGDPLLWQHLFWLFGHPEVYIIFLPSIALVAMIVPTFARRPMVGYGWVVLAAIGTGFLSFGLWVHHMYTTGLPGVSLGLFSAASTAVAIPTGIQFFCFVATLLAGRVIRSLPMLWVLGSVVIFVLGGLTGVMVAVATFDFQAHDTFFVVAHLHYVLIGGAIFPLMAGLYYYYPIISDRHLSERLGTVAFWLMFIGFNVTFLPMHLTGLRGMPRRVFTYPSELGVDTLNLVSTVGAFVLAAGFAVILYDVLRPKKKQPYAERNPWKAGTLEWVQEMPGEPWGIRSIPEIDSRYPLWDQPNLLRDIDEGRFYLPDAEEGLRETLVTTVIDGRPILCQRLPTSSFLPLLSALAVGGFFVFGTFHWWTLALASLALGLLKGAGHFETGCRPCHGAPDIQPPIVPRAMTPHPPYLSTTISQWSPEELFFIVKHGVKFTAMPAWPALERDDEIASVVAFLLQLPKLDARRYRELVDGNTGRGRSAAAVSDLVPSDARAQGLAASCDRCHGSSGEGRGSAAFPKLAGQKLQYQYAALQAYAQSERHSGIMQPVAAALSPEDMHIIARHYASFAKIEADSASLAASAERRANGERIAQHSVPSRGIPACIECHGPVQGARNVHYPRLEGQYADYLVLQLRLFKAKQRGGSAYAHLMEKVAARLDDREAHDVALYYGSLTADAAP